MTITRPKTQKGDMGGQHQHQQAKAQTAKPILGVCPLKAYQCLPGKS